jgi:hypothetical protein
MLLNPYNFSCSFNFVYLAPLTDLLDYAYPLVIRLPLEPNTYSSPVFLLKTISLPFLSLVFIKPLAFS